MDFKWENDSMNSSKPIIKKVLKFCKENKKEIIQLIIIGIIIYFIIIFVNYRDVIEQGFNNGWHQIK